MAHTLDALRLLPVQVWDRQGLLPLEWANLSQALENSGLEPPRILAPEGSFSILLRAPLDMAGMKLLLDQRDTWRQRLEMATVAVWWPTDETLYQMTCLFRGHTLLEASKQGKEWQGESRFYLEIHGSQRRTQVPACLQPHLGTIAALELDPDAEPIYRDWCLEHDWLERFPVLVARTLA
jgi:hypothetical protein